MFGGPSVGQGAARDRTWQQVVRLGGVRGHRTGTWHLATASPPATNHQERGLATKRGMAAQQVVASSDPTVAFIAWVDQRGTLHGGCTNASDSHIQAPVSTLPPARSVSPARPPLGWPDPSGGATLQTHRQGRTTGTFPGSGQTPHAGDPVPAKATMSCCRWPRVCAGRAQWSYKPVCAGSRPDFTALTRAW